MLQRWRHVLFAVAVLVGGTLILTDVLGHREKADGAGSNVGHATAPGNSASTQGVPSPTMDPAQSAACRLLSAEDITQAVGGSAVVGSGIPGVDVSISTERCQWAVTGSEVLGKNGAVYVQTHSGPDLGTSTFHKNEVAAGRAKAVPGLGDSAFFNPKLNTLTVLYRQGFFNVQILGFAIDTATGTLPQAEKMAQAMLKHT
jgi:hypothetical protein